MGQLAGVTYLYRLVFFVGFLNGIVDEFPHFSHYVMLVPMGVDQHLTSLRTARMSEMRQPEMLDYPGSNRALPREVP